MHQIRSLKNPVPIDDYAPENGAGDVFARRSWLENKNMLISGKKGAVDRRLAPSWTEISATFEMFGAVISAFCELLCHGGKPGHKG